VAYTQPARREEIEQLRDGQPAPTDRVPARQRATEGSLRQRLESLRAENQRLREENASLKTELAIAYGHQRQASNA
jgi:basic region leucine zipper protein